MGKTSPIVSMCRLCPQGRPYRPDCPVCKGSGVKARNTFVPVCPHCGCIDEALLRVAGPMDGDAVEVTCRHCMSPFRLETSIDVKFHSYVPEVAKRA